MDTHVIEAGFPVNSDAEFEAVRDIAEASTTTVCGLARVVEQDIEAALDSGVDMVHVFVSTSDVQLEDSMHATREEATERAVDAVERVTEAGAECMFSPMDATRTEESFLYDIVEKTADAGADWINIPDTCGVATPERFRQLVGNVVEVAGDARVDVHTHDDFGMASANALAGYGAGASQAQVSVNGIGERAGNAAYEEVVMSVESLYGVDTGVDTTMLAEISRVIEEKSDVPVPANKPVVGANAFSHESGIHAAGVIENSDTFEPGPLGARAPRGSGLRPNRRGGPDGDAARQGRRRERPAGDPLRTEAVRPRRRHRAPRRRGGPGVGRCPPPTRTVPAGSRHRPEPQPNVNPTTDR